MKARPTLLAAVAKTDAPVQATSMVNWGQGSEVSPCVSLYFLFFLGQVRSGHVTLRQTVTIDSLTLACLSKGACVVCDFSVLVIFCLACKPEWVHLPYVRLFVEYSLASLWASRLSG